jgi:hypothetical protein
MHSSEIASLLNEARFVPGHRRRRPAVMCSALLVACFRADTCLLMLQRPPPHDAWDLPHGAIPQPDTNLSKLTNLAAQLVHALSGVRLAALPVPYGYIDWGPRAAQAGWGWTACLYGEVGEVEPIPAGSWAQKRAFLHPHELLAQSPADAWAILRHRCIAAAFDAFDDSRDFWLIQPVESLNGVPPDDPAE